MSEGRGQSARGRAAPGSTTSRRSLPIAYPAPAPWVGAALPARTARGERPAGRLPTAAMSRMQRRPRGEQELPTSSASIPQVDGGIEPSDDVLQPTLPVLEYPHAHVELLVGVAQISDVADRPRELVSREREG